MIDDDRTTVIRIAAALASGRGMISPFREDNPKTTPKSILNKAWSQTDILIKYAQQLAGVAHRMKSK